MTNDSNEMTYSYLTHHILNTSILRDISEIKTLTFTDQNTIFPMDTLIYWFMYSYMTNKTTVLTS